MNFRINIRLVFTKEYLKEKSNYGQLLEFTLGNMFRGYIVLLFFYGRADLTWEL